MDQIAQPGSSVALFSLKSEFSNLWLVARKEASVIPDSEFRSARPTLSGRMLALIVHSVSTSRFCLGQPPNAIQITNAHSPENTHRDQNPVQKLDLTVEWLDSLVCIRIEINVFCGSPVAQR